MYGTRRSRWDGAATFSLLGMLLAVGGLAAPAAAHARSYVTWDVPDTECLDSLLGFGGLIAEGFDTLDPYVHDLHGTCYRAGHITAGPGGDVTFTLSDGVVTDVGGCVTQDVNGNGRLCENGDDASARFCNRVTVGAGFDFSRHTTFVLVDSFTEGSALLRLVTGGFADCGAGRDAYGTTGIVNHY